MKCVDLTDKISFNILQARKGLGMTQKQVADALGISEGQFSHYEKGRAKPDVNIIYNMCLLFNTSFDEWLGLTSVSSITQHPAQDENIKKYHCLNDDGKKIVGGYIDGLLESVEYQKNPRKHKIDVQNPPTSIIFYHSPASAGTGEQYGDTAGETIQVPTTPMTLQADYCIQINGDSMEPKYNDGDLVFVKSIDSIKEGKIGIFSVDGESYIKKLGDGKLISLNPKYPPITITENTSIFCQGEVIGRL